MKTFIIVNNLTKEVMKVGMIYKESGGFTSGINKKIKLGLTIDEAILEAGKECCHDDCYVKLVDISELPGGEGLSFNKKYYHTSIGGVSHRGWTDKNPGNQIDVDLDKAKLIAHERRRIKRHDEFNPIDEVIAKKIPGIDLDEKENERAKIREKYAEIQLTIDNCKDVDELESIEVNNGFF